MEVAPGKAARPDFTGTWRLSIPDSEFGFLPPPESRIDTVSHRDPELRILTRQVDANGDQTVERILIIGGAPSEILIGGRPRQIAARWLGDTLEIETRSEVSGRTRRIVDTWTLVHPAANGDRPAILIQRRHDLPGGAVHQKLLLLLT